jgi:predicted GNAT family acetyltransferase
MKSLEFHPVTPGRWESLEKLFGPEGAFNGCWCMWWRSQRSVWKEQKGEGNRRALKQRVDSGSVPGILAYSGGEAVAWCSVAPREEYVSLDVETEEDREVWSIVCFFVGEEFRGRGIMVPVIEGAVRYAEENGAEVVEGYPFEPEEHQVLDVGTTAYIGIASAFRKAGFEEVSRRFLDVYPDHTLPSLVMRCYLK